MKRLLAVAVILFGAASISLAGDCPRSRVVYSTYKAPTYYAPYQYTNYYPTYAATVYVPKVLEVEVQKDHYYSIDPIGAIQRLLKQEREGWVAQGQPAAVQPAPQPPVPQPLPQRQSIQAPVGGREAMFLDRNRPSAYQNPELVAMIQASCVKCHQAEQKVPLLTPDGTKLLDLTKCGAMDVYFQCNTGSMPKTSAPVDDKYMPLLAEWVRQSK